MDIPVIRAAGPAPSSSDLLLDAELACDWLVRFLRCEIVSRRGKSKVVLGLSGGVDSAVVASLSARALGGRNVHAFALPYRLSDPRSLDDAKAVAGQIGIGLETIDITAMVDGYAGGIPDISPARLGNVAARARMAILFDQSARLDALPVGTGNKSERLFGYFTWHADDAPPINPLGDLFKTQVYQLARHLQLPQQVIAKPPTADLISGQTDEGDLGISYEEADVILNLLTLGYPQPKAVELGFAPETVSLVYGRVAATHWKRRPPTTAMLSSGAIGEFFLRPVDY